MVLSIIHSFDEWTRAVDERPGDYAWYLNANGVLQEERRPEMTHASAVPEDEE